MRDEKRERLIEKIDSHLRRTARQLIKFDTLDETLGYLIDSFWHQFPCDFCAIILKENDRLMPKVWKGQLTDTETAFSFRLEQCSSFLLSDAFSWPNQKTEVNEENRDCLFISTMNDKGFASWFTVPLKDEDRSYGFCVIGFYDAVPLLQEAKQFFLEFGKDVASAIGLAQQKEAQKRKISGIEWMKESLSLGLSIDKVVSKIVERAAKGTKAKAAAIYLYDEKENCFTYQPPAYGEIALLEKIMIDDTYELKKYFPYLERVGGKELTVPLVVNLKTIGVLHVTDKDNSVFTHEDLEHLVFLASHVAALVENARLYKNEQQDKQRLRIFLQHHQELVKKTVEGENFDVITRTLGTLLNCSLLLFDRFFREISSYVRSEDEETFASVRQAIKKMHWPHIPQLQREKWISLEEGAEKDGRGKEIGIWPVIGGGDLLGYLAIYACKKKIDPVLRFTIEHAQSVYAIQFIKQKMVLEAQEQIKEAVINQLFEKKIEEREKIMQYANLMNWNLYSPHRVCVLALEIDSREEQEEAYIFDLETKKSLLLEQIKEKLNLLDRSLIYTRKNGELILILPLAKHGEVVRRGEKGYWQRLYGHLKGFFATVAPDAAVYLGVGGKTDKLEDYYYSYLQALQTVNVVRHRFRDEGIAVFEELGSYTLLFELGESLPVKSFVRKYLSPLLQSPGRHGADLFQTLRFYLMMNGNIKDTADALFIHRSTLNYRLEKIKEILQLDIDDAEQRFNLMMAYKLYDLFGM